MDLLRMSLAQRWLVYLLGQEASRLPEIHDLFVIELHELLIVLRKPIARHLTKPETGSCTRVRWERCSLVQTEAILAQDVLAVVLLERCQLVLGLNLSPVVHRLVHLIFLSFLVLFLKGEEAYFFNLAILILWHQITHSQQRLRARRVTFLRLVDVRQGLVGS